MFNIYENKIGKKTIFCFVILLLLSFKIFANPCSIQGGGVITYKQNISFDSTQNETGYSTGDISVDAPGSYYVGGKCDKKLSAYWSARPADGMVEQSDGWFSLSGNAKDYLQIKTQVSIFNARTNSSSYYQVPFTDIDNYCTGQAYSCGRAASSGSKVKINIRFVKPFVGFENIDQDVAYISANNNGGELFRETMVIVHLNARVTVPQTCELDSGKVVTMDFGNIGAPSFSQAGAGNKPMGVNPQTHTIAIKCKNIDAQALLSMRLETGNVSGNAMVSDNKDVGFIVAAGSDKVPLTPNNIDSKIQFQLDDNSTASVPITAWPVSITGNKPVEGKFTAEGYLRIDFD